MAAEYAGPAVCETADFSAELPHMADITTTTLYDRDFYAWLNEQAGLLRAGRLSELDIENLAEEIECLARGDKRELTSRLKILLIRLLKWRFQPGHRSGSWRHRVTVARMEFADILNDSLSLAPQMPSVIESAYKSARLHVAAKSGFAEAMFPTACPWIFDQVADSDFWPDWKLTTDH